MTEYQPKIQAPIDHRLPPATRPCRTLERLIPEHLTPTATVLETGCGESAPMLQDLKGRAGRLIGLDRDGFVGADPGLTHNANHGVGMADVADASIDRAVSRRRMAPGEEVTASFIEICRFLSPNVHDIFLSPYLSDCALRATAARSMGVAASRRAGRRAEHG